VDASPNNKADVRFTIQQAFGWAVHNHVIKKGTTASAYGAAHWLRPLRPMDLLVWARAVTCIRTQTVPAFAYVNLTAPASRIWPRRGFGPAAFNRRPSRPDRSRQTNKRSKHQATTHCLPWHCSVPKFDAVLTHRASKKEILNLLRFQGKRFVRFSVGGASIPRLRTTPRSRSKYLPQPKLEPAKARQWFAP
jgi:hypothetical protein